MLVARVNLSTSSVTDGGQIERFYFGKSRLNSSRQGPADSPFRYIPTLLMRKTLAGESETIIKGLTFSVIVELILVKAMRRLSSVDGLQSLFPKLYWLGYALDHLKHLLEQLLPNLQLHNNEQCDILT